MKPLASATLNVDGEHDLADEVLTRIEERENEMLLASVAEALLRPASPRPGSRSPRGSAAR